MTTKQKPKPRSWIKSKDPQCCCECPKEFKRGDKVYDVGVMMIHEGCVKSYIRTMKELGLQP